jgi:hypothetical protein
LVLAIARRSRLSCRATPVSGSRLRCHRLWRPLSSRHWRDDDPGSIRGADVAGGRPDDMRKGVDGLALAQPARGCEQCPTDTVPWHGSLLQADAFSTGGANRAASQTPGNAPISTSTAPVHSTYRVKAQIPFKEPNMDNLIELPFLLITSYLRIARVMNTLYNLAPPPRPIGCLMQLE